MPEDQTPAIACTLQPGDFKDRLKWIAVLNAKHLIAQSRQGRILTLTFDTAGREAVQELARREQSCCAFLKFDTAEAEDKVTITITAPVDIADALDEVFAPFLSQEAGCGCSKAAP